MDLKKKELEFPFGTFCLEKQDFSDIPLLPKIIRWNDPNTPVPFTFQHDFSGNVSQMVNNQYQGEKELKSRDPSPTKEKKENEN